MLVLAGSCACTDGNGLLIEGHAGGGGPVVVGCACTGSTEFVLASSGGLQSRGRSMLTQRLAVRGLWTRGGWYVMLAVLGQVVSMQNRCADIQGVADEAVPAYAAPSMAWTAHVRQQVRPQQLSSRLGGAWAASGIRKGPQAEWILTEV